MSRPGMILKINTYNAYNNRNKNKNKSFQRNCRIEFKKFV